MPAADLDAFEKKAELEKASKAIFKYLLLDAACNQIAVRELKEREPTPGEEMIERRVLELMPQECLGECLAEFSRFMDLYRFRLRHGAAWEQKPEGKEMMEKFDELNDFLDHKYGLSRFSVGSLLWVTKQLEKKEREMPEKLVKWLYRVRDALNSGKLKLDRHFLENGIK
ncbi:MAG: hypothetical protein KHX31_07020 [Akkermansia sp.]|uniref:hypothetical protein n=2 Tax=Akkermansia sp. TaxID=1872421 RepID=UPI0025C61FDB|nr:hypothetical protein [Akkermansia sp.]MBS5508370.1 hypothetical protein [Akkermansia sp.]